MSLFAKHSLLEENARRWYDVANKHVALVKEAGEAVRSYALSGQLYLSKSGWLLLSVPNALVRGAFDALHEPGAELPTKHSGALNAHVTIMRPEELVSIGGPDVVSERGHQFHYSLGELKEVKPDGWKDVSKVWFLTVKSPELEKLRRSYGLSSLPKEGKHDFHITLAIRKTHVLGYNDVSKTGNHLPRAGEEQSIQQLEGDENPLQQPQAQAVQGLWGPGNHSLCKVAELPELLRRHGTLSAGPQSGASEERAGLLPGELSLAAKEAAESQPSRQPPDHVQRGDITPRGVGGTSTGASEHTARPTDTTEVAAGESADSSTAQCEQATSAVNSQRGDAVSGGLGPTSRVTPGHTGRSTQANVSGGGTQLAVKKTQGLIPHQQETDSSCGPAAIKSIAPELDEAKLREAAGTTHEHGTRPERLIDAAQKHGFSVHAQHGMTLDQLREHIDLGRAVVCPIQWTDDDAAKDVDDNGHYVTCCGHGDGKIRFSDPASGEFHEFPEAEFVRRWHDKDADGKEYKNFGMAMWRTDLDTTPDSPGGLKREDFAVKKSGDDDNPYGENCPECSKPAAMRCRCPLGNFTCQAGHQWHHCPVHKRVNRGSGHGKGFDCTCGEAEEEPGGAKQAAARPATPASPAVPAVPNSPALPATPTTPALPVAPQLPALLKTGSCADKARKLIALWPEGGVNRPIVYLNEDEKIVWLCTGDWHEDADVKSWVADTKKAFPGWEVKCESESRPTRLAAGETNKGWHRVKSAMDDYYANGDHDWYCSKCQHGFDGTKRHPYCPMCKRDCVHSNRRLRGLFAKKAQGVDNHLLALSMLDDVIMSWRMRSRQARQRPLRPRMPKPVLALSESTETPKLASHNAPVIMLKRRHKTEEVMVCPHCNEEIAEKSLYTDAKGWLFHRPCFMKGKGSIRMPEREAPALFKKADEQRSLLGRGTAAAVNWLDRIDPYAPDIVPRFNAFVNETTRATTPADRLSAYVTRGHELIGKPVFRDGTTGEAVMRRLYEQPLFQRIYKAFTGREKADWASKKEHYGAFAQGPVQAEKQLYRELFNKELPRSLSPAMLPQFNRSNEAKPLVDAWQKEFKNSSGQYRMLGNVVLAPKMMLDSAKSGLTSLGNAADAVRPGKLLSMFRGQSVEPKV